MNIFAPQSELSLAEHTEILSVEANFTTGQHSRPIIAMKQDAMTGGYILTYGDVKIDKATFFDCLSLEYFDFDIMEKYNHILNVYKWKGIYDDEKNKLTQEIEQIKTKCQTLKEKFATNTTQINLLLDDKDFDKLTKTHATNKKKYQDMLNKKETETDAEELEIINIKIDHYTQLIEESSKKIEKILTSTENTNVKKLVQINQNHKQDYHALLDKIEYYEDNFEQEVEDRLMFTGRSLFSFLLPDDFEYYFENNISPDGKQLNITRGVLLSGTLNKAVIGSSSGSISHVLFLQYNARKACDFVSYYQMIINRWLMTRGLSVGIEDCVPKFMNRKDEIHLVKKKDDKKLQEYRKKGYKIVDFTKQSFMCVKEIKTDIENPIETTSAKSFSNALLTIQTEEDEELLELKINNALNNARDICQKLAKEALEPTNSFVTIIRSGAKGNDNNITQITSMLGQQNMEGQRMQLTFGGRTLPHFKKDWEEFAKSSEMTALQLKQMFEARGFVTSSFYEGLSPSEFYFHAVGGREGVIDTACKSVCYDTEILIQENGETRIVKIGEWIDKLLKGNKNIEKDNSENEERELLDLEREVYIPTCDLSGNVTWGQVTAVTRHNPTDKMYEIKTLGGRKVTVTNSHSLLIWNESRQEFERIRPDLVKAGDFVPTTETLCVPKTIYEYFDTSILFPKNEYLHGSEFLKAKKMLEELNDKTYSNKWWNEHNNKDFTLPYSNIQKFVRPLSRSNIEHIQENCIYPFSARRSMAMIKDKFEFSYENGVFLGLYIAEGNLTDAYVAITNKDPVIIKFVSQWFEKYNIKYETSSKINHIGGNSTTTRGYSTLLSTVIYTLCGKGAKNKFINPQCLSGPIDFIKGLLSGMFSGDGHVTKNSVEISTASPTLSDNICVCLSRLGIFGKQSISKITSTNLGTIEPADSHRISIRANWAKLFQDKISLICKTKQTLLTEMKPSVEHRNFQSKNDIVLDKIVSIELVNYNHEKVYDLTVPSTLNFGLANGLHVVDTAKTGYTQRKMVKKMEDLKVNYLGMVETSNKNIISFDYGGDNYDGAKIIYKKGTPLFVDVESVVTKLNCDYEWEQYTKKFPMKTNIEIIEEPMIAKIEKNEMKKKQTVQKIDEKIEKIIVNNVNNNVQKIEKNERNEKKMIIDNRLLKNTMSVSDRKRLTPKRYKSIKKETATISKKFDESIKKEDIKIFFAKKYKNTNKIDISSKLRENIIININLIPNEYLNDMDYGEDWKTMKQSWDAIVNSDYNVDKYVGRNRYNFVLTNTKDEHDIVYIEFKNNMESVYKLPDIINLKACSDIMAASYEEYYYKNFLQQVCKEAEIETPVPELGMYLDTIYKDKTTEPFFVELKEKVCLKEECDEIISDSIYTFMKSNLKKTNIQALRREIEECFKKEYIFWNGKNSCFERQKIVETFENMKVDSVRNQNTIVVKTKMHEYYLLLRWKNKKGVLYPCWQISIKKN